MKTTLLFICIALSSSISFAQGKYFTRNANIIFFSSTPVEDIRAENSQATAVLDAQTGAFEFSVLMKSFNFKKALMQEHFNENYVESGTFPKSTFKGKITNIETVDFSKNGTYPVSVVGELTIHGVTKTVKTEGTLVIDGSKVNSSAVFLVNPEDYKIEIPSVVRDKIAREVEVSVNASLEPLAK